SVPSPCFEELTRNVGSRRRFDLDVLSHALDRAVAVACRRPCERGIESEFPTIFVVTRSAIENLRSVFGTTCADARHTRHQRGFSTRVLEAFHERGRLTVVADGVVNRSQVHR